MQVAMLPDGMLYNITWFSPTIWQVKPLPPKSSARGTMADERPKRKHMNGDDDDDEQAISMIRKMFR